MRTARPILVLAVLVLGFVAWRAYSGRSAEVPEAFARYASLDDALAAGAAQNRPVVAVVGASWCPACQSYKRAAMAATSVREAIDSRAIGIYIDSDHDRASLDTLQRLRAEVKYLPTTLVIQEGRVTHSAVGAIDADQLISMIDADPTS